MVYSHEGLAEARLKHPHHKAFHKNVVSQEDEDKGVTRFYGWHIDAALYNLSPPKVMTLYAVNVPQGLKQIVKYDDGSGDELPVPLGTTAFVSGRTMFDILPPELKSIAVRTQVKYAPHPYVWMSPARAGSAGLGIESDGLEMPLSELPPWEESRQKTYPVVGLSFYFNLCMLRLFCPFHSSGRIPSRRNYHSKFILAESRNSSLVLFPRDHLVKALCILAVLT